jgi:hypothetical protein
VPCRACHWREAAAVLRDAARRAVGEGRIHEALHIERQASAIEASASRWELEGDFADPFPR